MGRNKKYSLRKENHRKKDTTKTQEERYYITSLGENVEQFSKAARTHWQIENNLHWHLDFTFKEDANTTTEKRGAKALGVIKRNVLTLLQLVKDYYRISMSLLRYRLSLDFEGEIAKIFELLNVEQLKKVYEKNNI